MEMAIFVVLLLEIYQKEIYKEQKCADIFEYAFKFARISRERVQKALRTLKNTEDKPLLRAQIAKQGLNKVAMVAKLATPETEEFFAQHVESMPQPVLQAYEKQLKRELSNQAVPRMILKNAKDVSKDVPSPTRISKNLNVATPKAGSDSGKCPDAHSPGVVPNQTIAQSHKLTDAKTKPVLGDVSPKFASRTIPIAKRREVLAKTGGNGNSHSSHTNLNSTISTPNTNTPGPEAVDTFAQKNMKLSCASLCNSLHQTAL